MTALKNEALTGVHMHHTSIIPEYLPAPEGRQTPHNDTQKHRSKHGNWTDHRRRQPGRPQVQGELVQRPRRRRATSDKTYAVEALAAITEHFNALHETKKLDIQLCRVDYVHGSTRAFIFEVPADYADDVILTIADQGGGPLEGE